ncbi:aldehyde dehydrogenase family protein [Candidatus Puniceispirillum sp.]|uniref:aldehyde dehydrogenase family protein n=1 Tax=Candidatus Puniceispirillum sp. TaxID=2026719 RepID=UPI003F6A0194
MIDKTDLYIDGAWVKSIDGRVVPVINPATEEEYASITLAGKADTESAIAAAKRAFPAWSMTSPEERLDYLKKLLEVYQAREREMAHTISDEMGAPIDLAISEQASSGSSHLKAFIRTMAGFEWVRPLRPGTVGQDLTYEPAGVVSLITPWNWPMNQVVLKVGAAIAAGCTMVLKPSEIAPLSGMLFAEMVDEVGLPAGVFNMINGDGVGAGSIMSSHPDIDVVSFTGSTRAGILITKAAADSVKNVSLELGGKSPNLIFDDCDIEAAVTRGTKFCFNNTGQSCNAATRMLVERSAYDQAVEVAARVADATKVDMPSKEGAHIGPLVSEAQFNKVQDLIQKGIDEGARLVAGGVGRPDGFNRGYFVRPTVFADTNNDMTIMREEIFGPVLSIMPFDTEDEAIAIANDTPFGLSAYLQTGDTERAHRVARQLRAGMVQVNGSSRASGSPFGGFKQSGVGREGGAMGIEEFLEVKTISGIVDA